MSDQNQNNGTALVVLGLLGFLAIIITGKFILDNNRRDDHCDHDCNRQVIIERGERHGPRVEVSPQIPQRPFPQAHPRPYTPCPEYHSNSEFWLGYNDAWARIPARMSCPEYLRGYDIGAYDRYMNRRDYYDRYYPPGFHIRVPGFRLDVR